MDELLVMCFWSFLYCQRQYCIETVLHWSQHLVKDNTFYDPNNSPWIKSSSVLHCCLVQMNSIINCERPSNRSLCWFALFRLTGACFALLQHYSLCFFVLCFSWRHDYKVQVSVSRQDLIMWARHRQPDTVFTEHFIARNCWIWLVRANSKANAKAQLLRIVP